MESVSSDLLLGRESLVDFDPLTQIATHIEVEDGKMTVASLQDAEDIVESNKLFYNSTDERARYGEKLTRVASIPMSVWFNHLLPSGIANDEDALKRWLDDPDQKFFRTRPGKLSR